MSSPQETVRKGGFFLSALPAYLEASPVSIAHYTDDISITEGFASAETTQRLSVRPWGILGAFRSPKHLPKLQLDFL